MFRIRQLIPLLACLLLLLATVSAQEPQKTANDYVMDGLEAQKAGRQEEALRLYAAALALDSKNFGATFNSGTAYMILKRWDEALSAFKAAAVLKPDDPVVQKTLASAYAQTGDRNNAIAALQQATKLDATDPAAYYALSIAYADNGEHEKSLAAIKEANRLAPNDLTILTALGSAYRENRKFVEAVEPLKRVAAARPNDVDALYLLGNTQLMAGTYDAAIKTLNQVLVLDPAHSEARERLRVASVRKNLAPELDEQRRQVAENPQSGGAHAELGQSYNAMGMFAEAEQEYLQAVNLEPKNADFQIRLCVNYSEWGKTDQGIECYQKAIQLKKHHVLYMSLADLYEREGKFDEAIAAHQKALELKPNFVFSLYELAHVLMRQSRNQEAIEPLRKLLEVEPKHVYGNYALGLAYALVGNRTGAMQQYYLLQTLNPRLATELLPVIPK